MARKPVSVFKRSIADSKGQYKYYIKIWDENLGKYSCPRSASSIAIELDLDEKRFPSSSRTGAILIGQELLRKSGKINKRYDPLLADYCATFWDWETSSYIQGRLARGLRIGKEHVGHCASYVKNYIRPAFPALKLSAVRPHMLESFMLSLKKKGTIGNRSINAIIDAIKTPLKEAHRLGLIPSNPGVSLQKLGDDSRPKGIPSEEEITSILSMPLDPRIRCSIMLGVTCGLRLGEIQALKLKNIEGETLKIDSSWGKVDGLKETKTGKSRIVPLPKIIHDALIELSKSNLHGTDGFLIYGLLPDAPLDRRAIARGFTKALFRSVLTDIPNTNREAVKKARVALEARNVTFHSLRHFANARLRGAVPDETLRKLTGHTTEAMTDHYDHTTSADLKALASAQEARILPFLRTA